MMTFLLAALSGPAAMPPPLAPRLVATGPVADLACVATGPDGAQFTMAVAVRGQGPERTADIRINAPGRFPSMTASSRGVIVGSSSTPGYQETFVAQPRPGNYVLRLTWRDGRAEEVTLSYFPAAPYRGVATAICERE